MTPGQAEVAKAELEYAGEVFQEALTLLDAGSRGGTANRLYYAAFHAARAALTVEGRYSKTHSGQIMLFEQTFGPEPLLDKLLKLRMDADYRFEIFSESLDDLRRAAGEVHRFLERCSGIVEAAVARGPDEPDPPPDY